jgi:hypothetical protein
MFYSRDRYARIGSTRVHRQTLELGVASEFSPIVYSLHAPQHGYSFTRLAQIYR